MTDQNTTHSARLDDHLAGEVPLTTGLGGFRDEHDAELEARSQLAATLVPSAFPATGAVLADIAEAALASPERVARLRDLPSGRVYATFSEVWSDLGGTTDERPRPPAGAPGATEEPHRREDAPPLERFAFEFDPLLLPFAVPLGITPWTTGVEVDGTPCASGSGCGGWRRPSTTSSAPRSRGPTGS